MNYLDQSEQVKKIGNLVKKSLDKYEAILGFIFVILIILKISTNFQFTVLITLVIMILAISYFFSAFAVPEIENIGGFELFIHKLASWGCSVALMGLLYRLNSWLGGYFMQHIGSLATVFSLISIVILKNRKPDLSIFYSRWILRLLFISIIGVTFILVPKDSLIKAKLIDKVEQDNTK
jgi:hypothetical protein